MAPGPNASNPRRRPPAIDTRLARRLADGHVTDEEANLLNRLRHEFGVTDSAWVSGDLVPGQAGQHPTSPRVPGGSAGGTLDTNGARAPVKAANRNEAVRPDDGPSGQRPMNPRVSGGSAGSTLDTQVLGPCECRRPK